jgi:hypothetical protein
MPAGFAAIGAAVAGAFGATAISTVGAIAIGVVSSAVVGAAIGGLTAAVTGGDIGKGMLFGAVGGVVTGGLFGGGIASGMGSLGIDSASITSGALQQGTLSTGGGLVFDAASQEVVGTVAQSTGGGLFGSTGGTLGMGADTIGGTLLTKGIDMAAGMFKPGVKEKWGESEEGIRASWDHQKEMARLNASLRGGGGGGGGGSQLPWTSTEAGAKYQMQKQYELAAMRESEAAARLRTDYALQQSNFEKQYEIQTAKFGEAADVASGQKFQGASDAARDAIRQRQGDGGGGQAALQGFEAAETPALEKEVPA